MSTLLFTRPKKRTRQSKSHPSPPSSWNDGFAMPAPDLKRAKTKLNSRRHKVVVIGAKECDQHIPVKASQQATFDTVAAYGLLNHGVRRIAPKLASLSKMNDFHSQEYLEILSHEGKDIILDMKKDDNDDEDDEDDAFISAGLTPSNTFNGMWYYCRLITGATLVAAKELTSSNSTLAINWMGGNSNAMSDAALGTSYINDTALAIFALRHKFQKIAVIDLSATHPLAIQDAFYYTGNVFTVSVHRYEKNHDTYGTGRRKDKGAEGEGRHTNLNVNMSIGATDTNLLDVIKEIAAGLAETYKPECVILTVGTNSLSGGISKLNYTPVGMATAVDHLLKVLDVPTLLLGGDNTWRGKSKCAQHARLWTLVVDAAVNATKGVVSTLPNDIPDEDNPSWNLMGPSFELREEDDEEEKKTSETNDNTTQMNVKLNGIRERFRKYKRTTGL
tara:strand:+ start:39 stop:1376 length:1338 start_codon:yes stop_codon:yes gene_type:complete